MPPEFLEQLLSTLASPASLPAPGSSLAPLTQGRAERGAAEVEARVLAGRARNEDAFVIAMPGGKALVQSVDILTPVVNDPYMFGRIAAANALSDIYAMGGQPWSAMNIACFPTCVPEEGEAALLEMLAQILRGGQDALHEARAVLAGGHTVVDNEIKYGLAVTGIIDPAHLTTNAGLRVGDLLLLTKPLGTGILATGIKARWDDWEECEQALCTWCSRLNKVGGQVIQRLQLKAATDVTGFGLGGHLLEMAQASQVSITLFASALPLLPHAYEYACDGLIPAGSHNNRNFCAARTLVCGSIAPALESLVFDMQTSGGLVLALPPKDLEEAQQILRAAGESSWLIGQVQRPRNDGKALRLVPSEADA